MRLAHALITASTPPQPVVWDEGPSKPRRAGAIVGHMGSRLHSLHHTNIPSTDLDASESWYRTVFDLKRVPAKSNTKILLMTNGNFDLHFSPFREESIPRLAPLHFAVEVDDWDGFLGHLDDIGVRHTRVRERPENDSKFCYVHDPDGNIIELTYHGKLHVNTAATV